MKLTNKILLIALVLLLISFTAFRIMFNNRVELVPNPYKNGFTDSTFTLGKISAFEIKGNYFVHFIKSEYDSIKIKGADNLAERYTKIERNGDLLSIIALINLSNYPGMIELTIYAKNIESIRARSGSIIKLKNYTEDQLEVTAEDSSIVNAVGCAFNKVNATTKGNAVVSIENTINAIVNIQNTSSIFLTVENGEISGIIDEDAELILWGNIKNNTALKKRKDFAKGGVRHE